MFALNNGTMRKNKLLSSQPPESLRAVA